MRLIQLASLIVIAVSGTGIWSQLRGPEPAPEAVAKVDQGAEEFPVELPVFELPDPEQFSVIATRPLFSPSRRPPREPVEYAAPPKVIKPPQISLTAVSISGDRRVAVIRDIGSGEIRRIPQGDDIDEWTVVQVLPDRIILGSGDRRETILLFNK